MNCKAVLERLDDLIDGTLTDRDSRLVEEHLEDCTGCREELRLLRALLAHTASVPAELEPPRDLWPEIAERARRPVGAGLLGHPRPAMAVAAAVLIGIVVWIASRGGREQDPLSVRPEANLRPASSGLGSFDAAEAQYVQATGALLAALNERRGSLPPETLAIVDENLRTIDGALERIRAALREDPDNRALGHLLVSTHRKKLDTVQLVVKLATRI